MSGLREALAGYLDLRRSLGFTLERDAKLLNQFLAYLQERGLSTVTVRHALAWATLPPGASPGWLRLRMQVVRGFAAYLRTLDPATEVPPASLLPGGPRRAVPYLYSPADIAALFAQADRLATPLRRATMKTLIGLMAVTGMRGGEVVALDDEDLDTGPRGLLVVRHAKLGRHRLLPLHPSTLAALLAYRRLRDQHFPRPLSDALLVSQAGTRLLYYNVGQTFAKLARRAGLSVRSGAARPRPHDLRHSFAVATLLDWCRDGDEIAARMPLLSAYLGHTAPAHTYWYLHEGSGIASDGRETAGRQVIMAVGRHLRSICSGPLSREDTQTIPSDARCFRQKGRPAGVQINSLAAAPLPLLGALAHACGAGRLALEPWGHPKRCMLHGVLNRYSDSSNI